MFEVKSGLRPQHVRCLDIPGGGIRDGEAGAVPRLFCDRYAIRVRDGRRAPAVERAGGGAALSRLNAGPSPTLITGVRGRIVGHFDAATQTTPINEEQSVNAQVSVTCHELAHALVRHDRQAEDPELDYAQEELVAESVAHLAVSFVGLDSSVAAVPYLAGWAEAAAPDTFERIAELVDRLARRLETALGAQGAARSAADEPTENAAAPGPGRAAA